jgi:hypothetical protein
VSILRIFMSAEKFTGKFFPFYYGQNLISLIWPSHSDELLKAGLPDGIS